MNKPTPKNRRGWRWLIIPLLLIALLLGGLLYLAATSAGARHLASLAMRLEPRLSLQVEGGTLWHGLRLSQISWKDAPIEITLASLDSKWTPAFSPRPALKIELLHLQDLLVHDDRAAPPAPPLPWFERLDPARRSPIVLPEIQLPLNLLINGFSLDRARYIRGDKTQRIESLKASADLIGQDLTIRQLEIDTEQGQLRASGTLRLSSDYPLDMKLRMESHTLLPPHPFALEANLGQSLSDLAFTAQLKGIGTLEASGSIQPLDPRLPLKATLAWTNLAWPLEGETVVASKSGRLKVDGSLESYRLEIAGNLNGPSIPEGDWSLRGQGDLHQFTCKSLRGGILEGTLLAVGSLSWTNGLDWRINLQTKDLDTRGLHPAAPSRLNAQLHTVGHRQKDEWNVDLDIVSASGDWKEVPLTLQGQVTGTSAKGWQTSRLTVEGQSNTLHLAGSIAEEVDFAGDLHLPNPDAFLTDLSGSLDGTWSLKGPLATPDLSVSLTATNLAFRDRAQISRASLNAKIQALALSESHLELEVKALSLPEQKISVDTLHLVADGTRAKHQLTLEVEGSPATLSFALKGALAENSLSWTGNIQGAEFSVAGIDWALVDHLPLRWNPETQQLTVAPHRWKHNDAELRATEPLLLGTTGNAQLKLVAFHLAEFRPWLPATLQIDGTATAMTHLQWETGTLRQAKAALDIQNGALLLTPPPSELLGEAPPVEITCETLHLDTQLASTNWETRFTLSSTHLGTARAEAHIALTTNRTLGDWTGKIDVDALKLDVAQAFLPSLRTLSGELSASIRLSGTPHHPRLHGTLSLTNGIIEPIDWPIRLGDIHLQAHLQDEQARLSGGFRSGEGLGTLNGQLDITDNAWKAELQLTGDHLDLSYDSFAVFQASPDLTLRLAPGQLTLTGNILIPQADITIQKIPNTAVRTSSDAYIIDAVPGNQTAIRKSISDGKRSIDIELQLGDQINLSGYGITSRLAGHLRVRQTDTSTPSANGEIRIENGEFKAYGQDLHIRTGQFLFAGPLNRPTLYIEAIRNVTDYMVVAGLRIEGPLDALRTSLFSQPSLPDDEILPYLLLGRPLERGDSGAADGMLTSAAVSLGLSQGQGHAVSLAESLGIQNFQVGTQGGGEKTEVVVSGDLSSRLQVSYGSNLFAEGNTLKLRYRLARNLFLETVSSLTSSLELLYTFSY